MNLGDKAQFARNLLEDTLENIFGSSRMARRVGTGAALGAAAYGGSQLLNAITPEELNISPEIALGLGAAYGAATPWEVSDIQKVTRHDAGINPVVNRELLRRSGLYVK